MALRASWQRVDTSRNPAAVVGQVFVEGHPPYWLVNDDEPCVFGISPSDWYGVVSRHFPSYWLQCCDPSDRPRYPRWSLSLRWSKCLLG